MDFRLEKFEGPLRLLLELIEREELDITEVSLQKVADQYLDYIKRSNAIDPEEMADFLVVAARLLLIKSRALLPYLAPEEEAEIEDFERQLRMYKEFLEAAKKIQAMIGQKRMMFTREFNRQAVVASARLFSPPKKLKADDLVAVMSDIITRLRPAEKLGEHTLTHKIRIEDKIAHIENMLLTRLKFTFQNLMSAANSKTEVIVSFLALLELVKQRTLVVEQSDLFCEIMIERNGH